MSSAFWSTCVILAALMVGSLPVNAQSYLSAEEATKLLSGKTEVGKTSKGNDYSVHRRADGSQTLKTGNFKDTGTWRVTNDGKLCSKWTKIRKGKERCDIRISVDGANINMHGEDGTKTVSLKN